MKSETTSRSLRVVASVGLALGGLFGMLGSFAPNDALRGLAWGIDGVGIVVAAALLAVYFFRQGQDIAAAGFIVLSVGESVILSGAAMPLEASGPSFGAGASLWAAALMLVSAPRVFPVAVRILGVGAAVLFAVTAAQIFCGVPLHPKSSPLPFAAYPVFVFTLFGWIWGINKST